MTAAATGASRKPRAPKALLRMGSVILAVAAFLAVSKAFGMGALPLGGRLTYWIVVLGIGQGGSLLVRRSLDRMPLPPGRVVLAGVLECLALAAPMTLVVWTITSFALGEPFRPARLVAFYAPVLFVTGVMVGLNLLAQRQPLETHAPKTSDPAPPRILARLPAKLRGAELCALQAEDHYVRFHTSAGSDLVLLRLSDAMAELDGIEGAQVHRSWWVARQAVATTSRASGKLSFTLIDGTQAPVSRTYVDALRSAGWFDGLLRPSRP